MKIFKYALRTLSHYKLYSTINLLGLALSLTCVVIIARYVYSELTVDGFNTKLNRIYITTAETSNNPGLWTFSGIFNPNGEKNFVDLTQHPSVEKHASFIPVRDHEVVYNRYAYPVNLLAMDSALLQILDYTVIAGTSTTLRPEDALLTETFAAKIFGDENPIGQTLYYATVNKTVTVAGVLRTPAHKSVLSFDMLVPAELNRNWGLMPQSLVLLYPDADYRDLNRRYGDFAQMSAWGYGIHYQLFPYKDVYFSKHIVDYMELPHGNKVYVFVLSSIGVLLLLIGLVNYMNIHAVVTMRRSRELGMKKVFGASGVRIFTQLLVENLLLIVAALLIAFWMAAALHPFVENRLGIRQYPNFRFDSWLAFALLVLLPATVSVAPYLKYRFFSPVRSLQLVSTGNKSLFSRKFFLGFQYFMTVTLISVSLFFTKQLDFMLNKDLGYRTQNIIKTPFLKKYFGSVNRSDEEWATFHAEQEKIISTLTQKLNESTLLEYWSFGDFPTNRQSLYKFTVAGKEMQTIFRGADETWFKLFDVKLLEGRLWNNETDHTFTYNLIVSKSMLDQFGITDYRDAEVQPFRRIWWMSGREEEMATNPPCRIVGVVEDFHTEHLSKPLAPAVFYFSEKRGNDPVIASFAPENRREVLRLMNDLHDELIGGEFTYSFIEDEMAKLYAEDKKVAVICTAFTGAAILISMLGLLGISLFDIRQRRKEIAIRKVNGAQLNDVIRLLLKKYLVLLAVAFAVSLPVALLIIYKYLENFAYKTSVSWWLFATALLVTLAVSLLTLIYQIIKAGSENPADVIKSE